MAVIGELVYKITGDSSGLKKSTQQSEAAVKGLGGKVSKLAGGIKLAFAGVAVAAIGTFVKRVVKAASDAEEVYSKFATTFKAVGTQAETVAKQFAASYGLAEVESKKLLSSTGDLLTGFGFSAEKALELSQKVGSLGSELASFQNISGGAAEASQRLTAAVTGETEGLKLLGIVIRQDTKEFQDAVEMRAKSEGITLQQAKSLVILDQAYKQSKNAIGDFARTQDSTANIVKQLGSGLLDLSIAIGQKLIPFVKPVLQFTLDLINRLRGIRGEVLTLDQELELQKQKEAEREKERVKSQLQSERRKNSNLAREKKISEKENEILDRAADKKNRELVTRKAEFEIGIAEATAAEKEAIQSASDAGLSKEAIKAAGQRARAEAEERAGIVPLIARITGLESELEIIQKNKLAIAERLAALSDASAKSTEKLLVLEDKNADMTGEKEAARLAKEQERLAAAERATKEEEEAIRFLRDANLRLLDDEERLNEIRAQQRQKRLEDEQTLANGIVGIYSAAFAAIGNLGTVFSENRIAEIEAMLKAELEAAGIAEETELQRLNKELAAAIQSGNQQLITEKQNEIKRAEMTAEAEKKIAQARYKGQMAEWINTLAQIAATTALALIAARTTPSVIGRRIETGIAIGTGITAAVAAAASKPKPPQLATGGIIMPQPGGVPTVQAENGAPELSLNGGQEGRALLKQFGREVASAGGMGKIDITLNVDGSSMGRWLYEATENGQARISKRGIV